MDSTYTAIGSMDINSTVHSVGQNPQQCSTPSRTESGMIQSPNYATKTKPWTGIISRQNSVFYSKQMEKKKLSSPPSSEVPDGIQAGVMKTDNQQNNRETLLSPQHHNTVFPQLQSPAQMSYGPVAGMGNWVPSQDLICGNIGSSQNQGGSYGAPIFGERNDTKQSTILAGFQDLAQKQSSSQTGISNTNILTSKDLNIPTTQSTQTQKHVTSNTNENEDDEEETTWDIEKDPFFSGTNLNIYLLIDLCK